MEVGSKEWGSGGVGEWGSGEWGVGSGGGKRRTITVDPTRGQTTPPDYRHPKGYQTDDRHHRANPRTHLSRRPALRLS